MMWAAEVLDRGRLKSYQEKGVTYNQEFYRSKRCVMKKGVGASHQRRTVQGIEENGSRESKGDVEGQVEFFEDSDPARCR